MWPMADHLVRHILKYSFLIVRELFLDRFTLIMSGVSRWHQANHQVMFPSSDFYPWLATQSHPLYMCVPWLIWSSLRLQNTLHIYMDFGKDLRAFKSRLLHGECAFWRITCGEAPRAVLYLKPTDLEW
jgi:hypothetical protein